MGNAVAIVLLASLCQAQAPAEKPAMTVKTIGFVNLEESEQQVLLGRLPIQVGSPAGRAQLGAAAKVVREFDACLSFNYLAVPVEDRSEVIVRITGLGRNCIGRPYIQQPELVQRVEPQYSESLQERGVKGVVQLSAVIGLDGTPREIQIIAGDPELAEAAAKAMLQWRFRPAFADAQPTEVRRTFRLSFGMPVLIAR